MLTARELSSVADILFFFSEINFDVGIFLLKCHHAIGGDA